MYGTVFNYGLNEGYQHNPFSSVDQNKCFPNSVDPDDDKALNEPSHQDLHWLCGFILTVPIWNNGSDQIQRWKSPFQKLKVKP